MVVTKAMINFTTCTVRLLIRPLTKSCIFYAFFYLLGAVLKIAALILCQQ